jgi:hypothetical protein
MVLVDHTLLRDHMLLSIILHCKRADAAVKVMPSHNCMRK